MRPGKAPDRGMRTGGSAVQATEHLTGKITEQNEDSELYLRSLLVDELLIELLSIFSMVYSTMAVRT